MSSDSARQPNAESPSSSHSWYVLFILVGLGLFALRWTYKALRRRQANRKNGHEQKLRHYHSRHSTLTLPVGVGSAPSLSVHTRKTLFEDLHEKTTLPLADLAVHTDFPRLARKFRLLSWSRAEQADQSPPHGPLPDVLANATVLLDAPLSSAATGEEIMEDILLELARQFASPNIDDIAAQFLPVMRNQARPHRPSGPNDMAVSPRGAQRDRSENLLGFLLVVLGEHHQIVRLLKACNQSTIAPAVIRLKVDVGSQHPYKDKRGSWHIDVIFVTSEDNTITSSPPSSPSPSFSPSLSSPSSPSPSSSSSSSESPKTDEGTDSDASPSPSSSSSSSKISEVVVAHRKRECSWAGETNPESHFEFTWTLQMSFDLQMLLQSIRLGISDVYFNPAMPVPVRDEVLRVLSSYMSTPYKDPSSS